MIQDLKESDTIYVIGNGGNMAVASHAAADITRLTNKKVWCLDSQALLTSIANDFGYENLFSAELEMIGGPGDILVAISSSGNSPNIINAIKKSKEILKLKTFSTRHSHMCTKILNY